MFFLSPPYKTGLFLIFFLVNSNQHTHSHSHSQIHYTLSTLYSLHTLSPIQAPVLSYFRTLQSLPKHSPVLLGPHHPSFNHLSTRVIPVSSPDKCRWQYLCTAINTGASDDRYCSKPTKAKVKKPQERYSDFTPCENVHSFFPSLSLSISFTLTVVWVLSLLDISLVWNEKKVVWKGKRSFL